MFIYIFGHVILAFEPYRTWYIYIKLLSSIYFMGAVKVLKKYLHRILKNWKWLFKNWYKTPTNTIIEYSLYQIYKFNSLTQNLKF